MSLIWGLPDRSFVNSHTKTNCRHNNCNLSIHPFLLDLISFGWFKTCEKYNGIMYFFLFFTISFICTNLHNIEKHNSCRVESGTTKQNPSSGSKEDLNLGPPDYKFAWWAPGGAASTVNTLLFYLIIIRTFYQHDKPLPWVPFCSVLMPLLDMHLESDSK